MDRKTRRFGLSDLMILIAAIAVAMMGLRELWKGLSIEPGAGYWSVTPARLILATTLSACATPLTLACLAFRIRRPRPAWRRVAIQPGTAALVACTVIFAVQAAEVALSLGAPKRAFLWGSELSSIRLGDSVSLVVMRSTLGNGPIGHIEPLACFGILTVSFASPCGPAVAAIWLVLALAGRWRPERSWIDRLGRVLGATWVLISLLAMYPV